MEREIPGAHPAPRHARAAVRRRGRRRQGARQAALLASFFSRADTLLIGGALANPFLAARGVALGASPVEGGLVEAVTEFFQMADAAHTNILLPTDVVVEQPGKSDAEVYPLDRIPKDAVVQDIGPGDRAQDRRVLAGSKTVFWNGPLGRAEDARFADGTREVLGSLGTVAGHHVAAGGDSARIAQDLGVTGGFQFISTGGGAALEFVQGLELPGLAVLPNA